MMPTRLPAAAMCCPSFSIAVVFPAPRKPPIITYCALAMSLTRRRPQGSALRPQGCLRHQPGRGLFRSPPHAIDDLVEHPRISGRVARFRIRRALDLIQPSIAVPVPIDHVDVLLEDRVCLEEPPADHGVQVAAGLETLEPTDLVTQAD